MATGILFNFGNETIEVRIIDASIYFRTSQFQTFATIDGLKLEKVGVIKEFPDLKDNEDWEKIAKERFKDKIKNMATEKEKVKYIIEELTKLGYIALYMQRDGSRPIKLK